jgi:hypothetical protein
LRINRENRKILDLYNSDDNRTTISYARYLMCVKLGYILSSGFEVDHIDNDKTNDDISNLQVLNAQQNKEKENFRYLNEQQVSYGYECANCGINFTITERELKMRLAQGREKAFCSRSCCASYRVNYTYSEKFCTIDNSLKSKIKQLRLEGNSSYKISEITGVARNTVMKYW